MFKFVYYGRQSQAGNGDNAKHTFSTQEWIINSYLKSLDAQGVAYEIVAKFEETKSGGGYYDQRPEFLKAVNMCKSDKSLTLLCAKAERLARNVRSGTELMETINFVLANAPEADNLQKQLEFMIAEREYSNTSNRWKDMYTAKKARAEKTGEDFQWGAGSDKYQRNPDSPNNKRETSAKGKAERYRQPLALVLATLKGKVRPTYRVIAESLTAACTELPSGVVGEWKAAQVKRIVERLEVDIYA